MNKYRLTLGEMNEYFPLDAHKLVANGYLYNNHRGMGGSYERENAPAVMIALQAFVDNNPDLLLTHSKRYTSSVLVGMNNVGATALDHVRHYNMKRGNERTWLVIAQPYSAPCGFIRGADKIEQRGYAVKRAKTRWASWYAPGNSNLLAITEPEYTDWVNLDYDVDAYQYQGWEDFNERSIRTHGAKRCLCGLYETCDGKQGARVTDGLAALERKS